LFQKIDAGASGLIVTISQGRAERGSRPIQPRFAVALEDRAEVEIVAKGARTDVL